jgi:phosphonate metabolism-associated iron-containing alcohol dehydrogenase
VVNRHNPVQIHECVDAAPTLARLLDKRDYILVTSPGWNRRGIVRQIAAACGQALAVIDSVPVNPTLEDLVSLEPTLAPLRGRGASIVGLGGGSVMDAAKAILVALAPGSDMALVGECARTNSRLPEALALSQLFCIPTTAGTGSEVTMTATLWDGVTRAKYSLSDHRLFSKAAILDPTLTISAPPPLTLSAGLDALSHSMESIWNVNHTLASDAFAASAITRIKRYLPIALANPDNLHARTELQAASLLAGLAISSTRTALAHSISYPLTGRFGLRHGLACSFTLPDVAAFNLAADPARVQLIAEAFGLSSAEELPGALRIWMKSLGVYDAVRSVVEPEAAASLGSSVITPGRADNNIRPATVADAHAILSAALDAKNWMPAMPITKPGHVIWITGLSGSGKTTLSHAVTAAMRATGRKVVRLDGDKLRSIIGAKGGYSEAERRELALRYAGICRALASEGVDVVCATMSLFHDCQRWNRENIPGYLEVYLKVDLETLIARDPKGLYRRALKGEVSHVVGIDVAYEEPLAPDLVIKNDKDREDIEPLVEQVLSLLSRPL